MNDILVPIDFSIYSISAAKAAAAIIGYSGGAPFEEQIIKNNSTMGFSP